MNLLAPGFLYALAALAIPIIIHLFQFRKVKRVFFSNTRFLEQVKQVSQTKRRLKHLLILFCRLAFLFFLIITFARPYIPGPQQGQAQQVDIYLDNSYSMSNEVAEGTTALDAAILYANNIVQAYPKGTRFRLLTNGFESSEQYYYTPDVILDKLTETTYSARSRDVEEVQERLTVKAAGEESQQRDVFLLSDMQRTAWPGELAPLAGDSTNRYFLVPFQYQTFKNIFVDSVYLEKPYYLPNLQNTLLVRIANTGTATSEVPVKLTLDGRQIATTTAAIPANGKELISFPLNFSIDRLNEAKIEIVDYPVTFDNEFNLVLRKGDPVHVLELREENVATPVERVYSDSTLFRMRSRQVSNFTFSELGWADLVVLNEVQQPSSALINSLQEYTAAGGRLLYIPHPEAAAAIAGKLAGKVVAQPLSVENQVRMTVPDAQNPFFEGVFEEDKLTFTTPQARPVLSWSGRADNILMLQTGTPFAGQAANTWLFSAPLTDAYTNFHRHALFVPVMYKIAFGSKSMANPLYLSTQQTVFSVQLAGQEQEQVYKLKQEQEEVIPAQHKTNRSLLLDVPAYTLHPGFYKLQAGDSVVQLLAFNHGAEESVPDQLPVATLAALAEEVPHLEVLDDALETDKAELTANFGAVLLWKWTLLLALLFLLCEVLLIRFWK